MDKYNDEDFKQVLIDELSGDQNIGKSIFSGGKEEEKTVMRMTAGGPIQQQFIKLHWHCGKFLRSDSVMGPVQ